MDLSTFQNKFRSLYDELAKIEAEIRSPGSGLNKSKEIKDLLKAFIRSAMPSFRSILSSYPDEAVIRGQRVFIMGESRKANWNYENVKDIAQSVIDIAQSSLHTLVSDESSPRVFSRLGAALNTIYDMFDRIDVAERQYAQVQAAQFPERLPVLQRNQDELSAKLDGLCKRFIEEQKKRLVDPREMQLSDAYRFLDVEQSLDYLVPIGQLDLPCLDPEVAAYVQKKYQYELHEEKPWLNLLPEAGQSAAFISISPSQIENDVDFEATLKDVLLRSFLHFGPRNYSLALVEGEDCNLILSTVARYIKPTSTDFIYGGDPARKEDDIRRLFTRLSQEMDDRIVRYKDAGMKSIMEYNARNSDNPDKFVLLVLKEFPETNARKEFRSQLNAFIRKGGPVGIFTLIIGVNKSINISYGNDLGPLEKPMVRWINVLPRGASCEDARFDFGPLYTAYKYRDLASYRLKKANNFLLSSIMEEKPSQPYYERISIPLGKTGNNLYSLVSGTEKSPYPFVLVTGSTGTGKSSIMHSIILSGAMKYSPEELEFHIVDFKTADTSAEYAGYLLDGDRYIPHVKYMSLKSRAENALDIINYLTKLMSQRNRKGKFLKWNQEHPDDRMPMVYVIIDEYEVMLAGGDEGGGDNMEKTSLAMAIQDGITTLLKRARTFGIGIIFSGQNVKGLSQDALNQISTKIAYYNGETVLRKIFPEGVDMSAFPAEHVGYAYASGKPDPVFTRMAFCGDDETVRKICQKIRERYPEQTAARKQTIIGSTSSCEIRLDSYLPWREEIQGRILDEQSKLDDVAEFESSRKGEIIALARPITIGQSSSSEASVTLEYSKDENGHNFYAFGRNENLCAIERNAILSFLFQSADYDYPQKKRVYFLDGSKEGVKDDVFGDLFASYPFLKDYVEYVRGPQEMSETLMELTDELKASKAGDTMPYFIVVHEVGWLHSSNHGFLAEPVAEEEEEKPVDEDFNAMMMKELGDLGDDFDFGEGFHINFDGASQQESEKKPKRFMSEADVRDAFKLLFLSGCASEYYVLASTSKHMNVSEVILNMQADIDARNEMRNYAVYGSYEMLKNKTASTDANANICYVLCGLKQRSTTRLYNYLTPSAEPWWNQFKKRLKEE